MHNVTFSVISHRSAHIEKEDKKEKEKMIFTVLAFKLQSYFSGNTPFMCKNPLFRAVIENSNFKNPNLAPKYFSGVIWLYNQ